MTVEEAIEFGNIWLQINEDCKDSSTYSFFQMAIKALQTQLKESPEIFNNGAEPESMLNADLISRRAAVSVANDFDATMVVRGLEKLPPVQPEQRTGHWIDTGNYFMGAYGNIDYVECSCCHEDSLEEGDYCPNCGAKMEG